MQGNEETQPVQYLNGERLYTVKELAGIMGVSEYTIRNAMGRGMKPVSGGDPVKLERFKTIGGIRSSLEAVERLHQRLLAPKAEE